MISRKRKIAKSIVKFWDSFNKKFLCIFFFFFLRDIRIELFGIDRLFVKKIGKVGKLNYNDSLDCNFNSVVQKKKEKIAVPRD